MIDYDIKNQIIGDRRKGMSLGQIAKKYAKAKATIQRIINSSKLNKLKRGPKDKISKMDKRRIKTCIEKNSKHGISVSCTKIQQELNLQVSVPTVFRALKCLNFDYLNLPCKFKLTGKMKQVRVRIARHYIESQIDWNRVIFSDEKKFTLDGCDSFYTWIDKNQSPVRIKNIIKSSSLMIWAMILPIGLISYCIMRGKQNSEKYMQVIKEKAIPIIKLNMGNNFVFQQDNCPIHVSKYSKSKFSELGIKSIEWPPYSPDLNIIENIWKVISDDVYKERPIKNLNILEERIKQAMAKFNEEKLEYVNNLYRSIPKRLCDILLCKGDRLKY